MDAQTMLFVALHIRSQTWMAQLIYIGNISDNTLSVLWSNLAEDKLMTSYLSLKIRPENIISSKISL